MAKTLEQLRTQLGQETGIWFSGTATGGGLGTIIDTNGLAHLDEDDTLVGALAYILAAGGAAPQGEARRITDYDATTQTITVEYNFTAVVGAGDTYEVYKSALSLDEIDEAINQAIRDAWPEVWDPEQVTWTVGVGGEDNHDVGGESGAEPDELVDLWLQDSNVGGGWQWMPRSMWRYVKDSQLVYFERTLAENVDVRALNKVIYEELAATESTTLDEGYLMAAAKYHLYEALAASTGAGHDISHYLDLMNYWGKVAGERKQALALHLERLPVIMRRK